jgi:predicted glycosyltransferase
VGDYYSLLDVFVIPRTRSRVTELVAPLKPYEAMGRGKALIVSDVAALKEVVTDGKTGRICKADDVDDLVRVCEELIDHAAKRTELGQQAYDWVKQHRTWEKVVVHYRDVYDYANKNKDTCHVAIVPKRKKQIVFYSQHLVGVGHHFRNRQIVRALSEGHEVTVFDGGRSIPGAEWPDGVRLVLLPALCAGRNGVVSDGQSMMSAQVMKKRQMLIADTLKRISADVFVIEFFPFCRWSLRPEILCAIDAVKRVNPNVKILCSLRDIPTRATTQNLQVPVSVPRKDGDVIRFYSVPFGGIHHEQVAFSRRYYEEVCPTLNAFFDAVLVHGDPLLSRLEDHFPWVEDIAIPIVYTGFVSESLGEVMRPEGAPNGYVLVSAGGGAEGYAIAKPCIEAWKQLSEARAVGDRVMVVFAGAFIDEAHFAALQGLCAEGPFRIERFSSEFLKWMQGADLSISRAGYNTCMNVLETHTRAILLPSIAMDDQEFRAQKFAELGLAEVMHPDCLSVDRMADAILRGLSTPVAKHHLNLDGAVQTRKFIESL